MSITLLDNALKCQNAHTYLFDHYVNKLGE